MCVERSFLTARSSAPPTSMLLVRRTSSRGGVVDAVPLGMLEQTAAVLMLPGCERTGVPATGNSWKVDHCGGGLSSDGVG